MDFYRTPDSAFPLRADFVRRLNKLTPSRPPPEKKTRNVMPVGIEAMVRHRNTSTKQPKDCYGNDFQKLMEWKIGAIAVWNGTVDLTPFRHTVSFGW